MASAGSANLTRRVISSATALGARTAWERALGLFSTLFVARWLTPHDLGKFALVLSATTLGLALMDSGIATSLVRRPEPLTRAHIDGARRLQVLAALAFVTVAGVVAIVEPAYGLLLLVGSVKLPLRAASLPVRVQLQRAVEFQGLAFADALQQLVVGASAISLVFVERGALALVAADVLGAAASCAFILGRLSRVAPAPAPSAIGEDTGVRQIFREAMPFQGFAMLVSLRELTVATFIGALVGIRTLGLLQFAYRVLTPVMVVFQSMGQLAIPVGAQALHRQDRAQRQVQSGFLVMGMVTAVILAVVAAPSPWLVPVLFGAKWSAATPAIAAIALALVISGPINSMGVGLLLAAGRSGAAAVAVSGSTALFVVAAVSLRPLGGVTAGSLAWVISAVAEAALVVVACRRLLRLSLVKPTVVPVLVFVSAYAAGRLAGDLGSDWLVSGVLATVAAAGLALLLAAVFALRPLRELVRDARPARPLGPGEGEGIPALTRSDALFESERDGARLLRAQPQR